MIRNMKIRFAENFRKQYDKSGGKIKTAFDKRLKLFIKAPFNSLLNNHPLTGKYLNYRSINITGDWRAIYSKHIDENEERIIIFELLGTHSQLYK